MSETQKCEKLIFRIEVLRFLHEISHLSWGCSRPGSLRARLIPARGSGKLFHPRSGDGRSDSERRDAADREPGVTRRRRAFRAIHAPGQADPSREAAARPRLRSFDGSRGYVAPFPTRSRAGAAHAAGRRLSLHRPRVFPRLLLRLSPPVPAGAVASHADVQPGDAGRGGERRARRRPALAPGSPSQGIGGYASLRGRVCLHRAA